MIWAAKIYGIAIVLMSVITFLMFGIDKRNASKNPKSRIPENKLHLAALLGGWPGALAGQKFFRHKTIKPSFRLKLWLAIGLHLLLVFAAIYFFWSQLNSVS